MENKQSRRQQVEALLRQYPDWRFAQIAIEAGVSRARVSQIAHEMGIDGISRAIRSMENSRQKRIPALVQNALAAARAAGIEAEPIRRQSKYHAKRISVGGRVCFLGRLAKVNRTHPAQLHGYYRWLVRDESDLLSQCDFVLLHTPRGWFVIPAKEARQHIYISADPEAGPESNWFRYLEAWRLLK